MVETVEQLLGIDINHVAIVDFAGFRDLIDSLGGIDIELGPPGLQRDLGRHLQDQLRRRAR